MLLFFSKRFVKCICKLPPIKGFNLSRVAFDLTIIYMLITRVFIRSMNAGPETCRHLYTKLFRNRSTGKEWKDLYLP